jgi:hypothetical protein
MEAVAMSKSMAVRHAPATIVRHFRLEVAPQITEVRDGEATSSDALFDLYADMSFRMIETAIHKNRQDFIQQFAARNSSPKLRRVPYKQVQPPKNAKAEEGEARSPKQKFLNILSPKLQMPFSRRNSQAQNVGSPSQRTRTLSRKTLSSPFSPSRKNVTAATQQTSTAQLPPTQALSPPLPKSPPPVRSAPELVLSSSAITPPSDTQITKSTEQTMPTMETDTANTQEESVTPSTTLEQQSTENTPESIAHAIQKSAHTQEPISARDTQVPTSQQEPTSSQQPNGAQDSAYTQDTPTAQVTSPEMRASPTLASSRADVNAPPLALSQELPQPKSS